MTVVLQDPNISFQNAARPPKPIGVHYLPKNLGQASLESLGKNRYKLDTGGWSIPTRCFGESAKIMLHLADESRLIVALQKAEPFKGVATPPPNIALFESSNVHADVAGKMVSVSEAQPFDIYTRNHWGSTKEAIILDLESKLLQNDARVDPRNALFDLVMQIHSHEAIWSEAFEKVYDDDKLTYLKKLRETLGESWTDVEVFTTRAKGWAKAKDISAQIYDFVAEEGLTALVKPAEHEASERILKIQLIQAILETGTSEYINSLPFSDPLPDSYNGIKQLHEYLVEVTKSPAIPPLLQDEPEKQPLTDEQKAELERAKKLGDPGQSISNTSEPSLPITTISSEEDTLMNNADALPSSNSEESGSQGEKPKHTRKGFGS